MHVQKNKIRVYHERLPLKGFFLHKKDGFIEIYFRGKRIRVFENGVFGYIRFNGFNAKRNKYHRKKKGKIRMLKSELPRTYNISFVNWNERKLRERR